VNRLVGLDPRGRRRPAHRRADHQPPVHGGKPRDRRQSQHPGVPPLLSAHGGVHPPAHPWGSQPASDARVLRHASPRAASDGCGGHDRCPANDPRDPRYRDALLHLLAAETSCYRYWGGGCGPTTVRRSPAGPPRSSFTTC